MSSSRAEERTRAAISPLVFCEILVAFQVVCSGRKGADLLATRRRLMGRKGGRPSMPREEGRAQGNESKLDGKELNVMV